MTSAFLIGIFVLLFYTSGNLEYLHLREVFSDPAALMGKMPLGDSTTITIICICLFIGRDG